MDPIIIHVPSEASASGGGSNAPTSEVQLSAQDVMMQHETSQTKVLSDEQLKRLILLQQLKVVELHRQKVERDLQTTNNGVNFELIGFNGNNPTDFNDFE